MSYHNNQRSASVADKIKRSDDYYLPSGDVIFLVENYLYRVHRYFFERESPYFRQRFSAPAPPGQAPKGTSDSNPFPLEETTVLDFNRFLYVFYNPKFSIYECGADEWISILKLSVDWGFDEVKRFAVRELETKYQEPLDKIQLYHSYRVDKLLLVPSYIAMALRPEPLTLAEGQDLGLETALAIARAREFARGTLLAPKNAGEPGTRQAAKVNLDKARMDELIREIFLPVAGPPVTPRSATAPLNGVAPPPSSAIVPGHEAVQQGMNGLNVHGMNGHARMGSAVQSQPAANLFEPAPAPARDLSQIWSSPPTTAVESGTATPALIAEPKSMAAEARDARAPTPAGKDSTPKKPVSKIDTTNLAGDLNSAEQGNPNAAPKPEEEGGEDSWFGLGKNKKKGTTPATRGGARGGSRV